MAVNFNAAPVVSGHIQPQERIKDLWATMAAGGATTPYDHSTSGLTATTVKGAIDELAARVAALEA